MAPSLTLPPSPHLLALSLVLSLLSSSLVFSLTIGVFLTRCRTHSLSHSPLTHPNACHPMAASLFTGLFLSDSHSTLSLSSSVMVLVICLTASFSPLPFTPPPSSIDSSSFSLVVSPTLVRCLSSLSYTRRLPASLDVVCLSLTDSLVLRLSRDGSLCLSLIVSLSRVGSPSLVVPLTHFSSLVVSLTQCLSFTHIVSLTHSLSHSLSRSLVRGLTISLLLMLYSLTCLTHFRSPSHAMAPFLTLSLYHLL